MTGPFEKINLLVSIEDSLYYVENQWYSTVTTPIPVLIDTTKIVDTTRTNVVDTINVNYQYYKVKAGDNIKNIALKYGVTVEQLMEWNGLKTANIYVGQRLTIKEAAVKPKPVPVPVKPQPVKKYYVVKTGDTFSRIAQRNNLTLGQLQKLNPGVKVNSIVIGQRIRIK